MVLGAILGDRDVFAIEVESDTAFNFSDKVNYERWDSKMDEDDFRLLAGRTDDVDAANVLVDEYLEHII